MECIVKKSLILALCAAALAASPAFSAPKAKDKPKNKNKPVVVVPVVPALPLASAADISLASEAADGFVYAAGLNAQGKPGSSVFDDTFKGNWDAIGGFSGAAVAKPNGLVQDGPLSFTFGIGTDGKQGTWSVTNNDMNNDVLLDLVFAMHTGGGSGAWLFNDVFFNAGETQDGQWFQRMLNNGNQVGGYSNVTFFAKDLTPTPTPKNKVPPETPTEVPEPATLGTLMLGLGMLGYMHRRRKQG